MPIRLSRSDTHGITIISRKAEFASLLLPYCFPYCLDTDRIVLATPPLAAVH